MSVRSLMKIFDPVLWYLTKPIKQQEMAPSSITNPTTSEEGKYIGVLWGTRDIKSLNYTYFGDVKQVAIKSKSGKK